MKRLISFFSKASLPFDTGEGGNRGLIADGLEDAAEKAGDMDDFGAILADFGKRDQGKACLYINKLEGIVEAMPEYPIRAGLDDLRRGRDVFAR